MPRTMLTDQHWQKLKAILRNLSIHHNSNLRNFIDFIITDGNTHDVKVAPDLISTLDLKETKVVCADKGYDSEPLREQIRKTGTKANIPKKTNSQSNNDHMDWYLYKMRHLVENMFC